MEKNLVTLLENSSKQRLLFFLVLFFNLVIAFVLIISPVTSIRGAEPNVIYTIQRSMLNSAWMYQDPESIPFSATQYTPLYYMICSALGNLLSLTPGDEVVGIYQLSRMISFISALLVSYFIFLTLYRVLNINRQWSYWISLLCVLCTFPWYYAVRPDSLMALFFFASIYCFGRYIKEPKGDFRYLLAAGILAALSFFSKQNGLIVAIAVGSYLLFGSRIKDLGIFIGGFLTGALLFSIVFYPFFTNFFFDHVLQGLNNGVHIRNAINIVYYSFISRFGILAIVTFIMIFILHLEFSYKNLAQEIKFLIWVLAINFFISTISVLKPGSDINYFNEIIGVSLILLCKAALTLKEKYIELNNRWIRLGVFCLIFAFAVSTSISGLLSTGLRNLKRMNEKSDVYNNSIISVVKEIQKNNPGEFYMMADESFIINAFPGQNVVPHTDIASLWYTLKIYDYEKLKSAILQGKMLLYIGNGAKLMVFDIDLANNFFLMETIEGHNIYINKHAVFNR